MAQPADLPLVKVKSLKVAELKDELEKRGLDTTGLKKDDSADKHRWQLADRLEKAQNLMLSGGTENAPLTQEVADEAVPLKAPAIPTQTTPKTHDSPGDRPLATAEGAGEGVGHPMVEGDVEAAEELHEKEEKRDVTEEVSLQPAALDEEVAEVISREEAKDVRPASPSPVRRISPMSREASPSAAREEAQSKEDGYVQKEDEEEMAIDEDEDEEPLESKVPEAPEGTREEPQAGPSTTRKRLLSPSPPPTSKRHRAEADSALPLPSTLSHLHSPTQIIYLSNLRRPLQLSSLHDYLFPSSTPSPAASSLSLLPPPRSPFSSPDQPGLWLSGVKDHAYATYLSPVDALEAAERMHGKVWPEETGVEVTVQFIPEDVVRGLVEREEDAWMDGRQKLTLKAEQGDEGWIFELQGGGAVSGTRRGNGMPNGRPAPGMPPGRVGGMGAPGGMGMGIRGRGPPVAVPLTGSNVARPPAPQQPLRGAPPHLAPRGPANGGDARRDQPPSAGRPAERRPLNQMRRTKVRPGLFWKEGPGAAVA